MHSSGLLILTNISRINNTLSVICTHAVKTLYVHLHPKPTEETNYKFNITNFSRTISRIYAASVIKSNKTDVRIILTSLKNPDILANSRNVDIIFYDNILTPTEMKCFKEHYTTSKYVSVADNQIHENDLINKELVATNSDNLIKDVVVLGGTFDRLHVGHKILLSEAALRAKQKLIVGVTDVNMIQSKKLHELILPVEQRIIEVRNFLNDIDKTLEYEVVAIQDPFGPTRTEPNIDLIVVSTETMKGGEKVNEVRKQNNLRRLSVHCIDLVEADGSDPTEKEIKVSSSNQRIDLLGTRIRNPEKNTSLPTQPYIIGLTGGIASGKSKLSERLKKMGAGIIDCDKLAHQLYEPGQPCYEEIKNVFGMEVIAEDSTVDRKKLGAIVFSDKNQLQRLNGLIWPHIQRRARERAQELYEKDNYSVIIMEAALLIQAGWYRDCHEIWGCIIPKDEAVRRIIERNNLTEEEALKRIGTQIENATIVEHSHVVFSTLWSYEFTQVQVARAWRTIVNDLKLKL